ncbi:hypothetical protein [Aliikangiella coralliicola]|uniref:Uncharacterized protein n=1 Tax=Aliikangiella coralliicola TaxID=2592383 RepID=A0A545U073_9GAMM|nr:hypothetical protein [Aliikangiella coralliicola]TQV82859.1 hypothetical protein FLL46_24120 [Aliikangiella coralliicola]
MASFDSLVLRVKQECPSLMDITATSAVRDAVREFLRSTEVWQTEIEYTLPGNTAFLDLSTLLPTDAEVMRISSAFAAGIPLRKATPDTLLKAKNRFVSSSTPRLILQRLLTFEVFPVNSVATEIKLNVILRPSKSSNYIDDAVLDEWEEGFAAATLFKLMMQPKKPWTNPESASFYRGRYFTNLSQAKGQALTANGAEQQQFNKFI